MTNDYKIALATVPELVMTETHPSKFLRCERGNAWSAALRLVQNWTKRRRFFGESHWLLPMRLREGALRSEDVALLQTGGFMVLTPSEPYRRQVFVANFGRFQTKTKEIRDCALLFIYAFHPLMPTPSVMDWMF